MTEITILILDVKLLFDEECAGKKFEEILPEIEYALHDMLDIPLMGVTSLSTTVFYPVPTVGIPSTEIEEIKLIAPITDYGEETIKLDSLVTNSVQFKEFLVKVILELSEREEPAALKKESIPEFVASHFLDDFSSVDPYYKKFTYIETLEVLAYKFADRGISIQKGADVGSRSCPR